MSDSIEKIVAEIRVSVGVLKMMSNTRVAVPRATMTNWADRLDSLRQVPEVRIATKGPDDFSLHVCPAESAAVWNACVYEHQRIAEGLPPLLSSTEIDLAPPTSGECKHERSHGAPWRCAKCGYRFDDATQSTPAQAGAELPAVNERCQRVMRERGKVYPRTCYVCGIRGDCIESDATIRALQSAGGGE